MSRRTTKNKKIDRDCWNLDTSFFRWLSERLPIYLKRADKVIDLEREKFSIKDETLTQKEVIKRMIKCLDYIKTHDDFDEDYQENVDYLMLCWSTVILSMWW